MPTVEEVLWKALNKARLIFPDGKSSSIKAQEVSWEGCDYSKCGRTDKGVSAFGQVIGIRVRSNRPLPQKSSSLRPTEEKFNTEPTTPPLSNTSSELTRSGIDNGHVEEESPLFHAINDEILYPQILNRVLPLDIHILAWCPSPPAGFSARFSCRERQYRYFFTQPAFSPTPGMYNTENSPLSDETSRMPRREGWLDIKAMQDGAKRFVGLHDFRNFCKVDASKQIDNFERRIFHSAIEEVDPSSEPASYISGQNFSQFPGASHKAKDDDSQKPRVTMKSDDSPTTPKVYVFVLHGSAFLWHQVRHMIAILFLIGQGLESPELVTRLLDIHENPSKPLYEMADDAPLVLWDCKFPSEGSTSRENDLQWIYSDKPQLAGVTGGASSRIEKGNGKFSLGGMIESIWELWRRKKMAEILAGQLLNVVTRPDDMQRHFPLDDGAQGDHVQGESRRGSQRVYFGGNAARPRGKYIPVLERPRMDSIDIINGKYAARKGFSERDDGKASGFRRIRARGVDHTED